MGSVEGIDYCLISNFPNQCLLNQLARLVSHRGQFMCDNKNNKVKQNTVKSYNGIIENPKLVNEGKYRNTEIQKYRETGTQEYRNTVARVSKSLAANRRITLEPRTH